MDRVETYINFQTRTDGTIKVFKFSSKKLDGNWINIPMDYATFIKIRSEIPFWEYKDGKLKKMSTTKISKKKKQFERDREIRNVYFKEKQVQLQNLYAIETDNTRTLEERTLAHIQREALEVELRKPVQAELLQRLHDDPDCHDWYHARLTERGWLVDEVVTIP